MLYLYAMARQHLPYFVLELSQVAIYEVPHVLLIQIKPAIFSSTCLVEVTIWMSSSDCGE